MNTEQQNIKKEPLKYDSLESVIEKLGEIISPLIEQNQKNKELLIKLNQERELKELEYFNIIDKREKIFKGLLLFFLISIMLFFIFYTDKSEVIIPLISLIIGFLLKSNSSIELNNLIKVKDNESVNSEVI